jgi:hypothetical protein
MMKGVLILVITGYLAAYFRVEEKVYGFVREWPSMEHKTLLIWVLTMLFVSFLFLVYPLEKIARKEQIKVRTSPAQTYVNSHSSAGERQTSAAFHMAIISPSSEGLDLLIECAPLWCTLFYTLSLCFFSSC